MEKKKRKRMREMRRINTIISTIILCFKPQNRGNKVGNGGKMGQIDDGMTSFSPLFGPGNDEKNERF